MTSKNGLKIIDFCPKKSKKPNFPSRENPPKWNFEIIIINIIFNVSFDSYLLFFFFLCTLVVFLSGVLLFWCGFVKI